MSSWPPRPASSATGFQPTSNVDRPVQRERMKNDPRREVMAEQAAKELHAAANSHRPMSLLHPPPVCSSKNMAYWRPPRAVRLHSTIVSIPA